MNEQGWLVSLQQPNLSQIYITGFNVAKDEVLISHDRSDASIFENVIEASEFLDLIRPNLLESWPACKFFVDEL